MTVTVVSATSWTDIMTAFGTVGAVVAAVGIALWAERRSDRRLRAEQERSDRQLADERAHSRAQIEEERRLGQEREQLAEAYAVQVVAAEVVVPIADEQSDSGRELAVLIVNRGQFTITRVEAQFSVDGTSLISHHAYERMAGFVTIPEWLRAGWGSSDEHAMYGVLAPWDLGIRFETDTIHVKFLKSPYPLVRWTDHRGTRWEHKRGEVRQIRDGEPWAP